LCTPRCTQRSAIMAKAAIGARLVGIVVIRRAGKR
jgi:hypothetical protein